MNERGLKVYDGVIVTCAETGEMWSVETVGEPDEAHAEVDPQGKVVFVLHDILDAESESDSIVFH